MTRLFSTFPSGWPGRGLLLLRVAVAVPLLLAVVPFLADGSGLAGIPLKSIGIADCVFLLIGLGTPFAAGLQVLIEGWLAFVQGAFTPDHLVPLLVGLVLLMTGPGQYSLDRRIYGPKRIELRR
jgi:uncharacterized membrane protein YphA (DoxX/SURF4 family)